MGSERWQDRSGKQANDFPSLWASCMCRTCPPIGRTAPIRQRTAIRSFMSFGRATWSTQIRRWSWRDYSFNTLGWIGMSPRKSGDQP